MRTIEWRKSSRSGGDSDPACVELAGLEGRVWVRDSKDPGGERLAFGRDAFAGLLERVKSGEFGL
ncbi:DUF397 domain-containing protein [Actinomadura darangshiensis]|uniref:DUF397 domain-containing protein n=1 Tax=Actinomadura darangshiensis TaxID=705336 RepID=A0A4R5AXC7_9ACTN|nr:DUF397 domain-containing protein [Actinomadura darangshiensis]TDD76679.1 DUF397 domain-containing protein [Actinomadura darangshiensis]